jgi:hypothetical protein
MHFDKETMWSFRFEDDPTFKDLYLAGMGVCDDPSCPCAVVTIACQESEPAPGAPEGMPYVFSLDLDTRKIAKAPSREGHPESTKFGRTFVRELDEKNWVQLRDVFLSAKRRLSENLNPDKVKYRFDAREIEDEHAMVSYISVLPFEDKLSFTCDSREYLVSDYYCLNSRCSCKDVRLVFHEEPAGTRSHAPIVGSLTYSYDSQTSTLDEGSTGSREHVQALFDSLKTARPDLRSVIRKRHRTLRLLYERSRHKRHPPSSTSKAGRNDPCARAGAARSSSTAAAAETPAETGGHEKADPLKART